MTTILLKEEYQTTKTPCFTPLTKKSANLISRFSSLLRAGASAYYFHLGILTKPVAFMPLTVTSSFGAIFGPVGVQEAYDELLLSQTIGDRQGKVYAGLKVTAQGARSVAGVLRGIAFIFYKTTFKTLKVACSYLGATAVALGSVTTFFNLITNISTVYHLRAFRHQLTHLKGAVALLQKEIRVSSQEKKEIKKRVKASCPGYTRAARREKRSELMAHLQLKKKREMQRVTNSYAVDALKTKGLKTEEVCNIIKTANKKKLSFFSSKVALGILKLTIAVLGLAASSTVLSWVIIGLTILFAIGHFSVEAYAIKSELHAQPRGRYDYLWLLFSSLLGIGVIAASLRLSVEWISLVTAIALGLLWLILYLLCFVLHFLKIAPSAVIIEKSK